MPHKFTIPNIMIAIYSYSDTSLLVDSHNLCYCCTKWKQWSTLFLIKSCLTYASQAFKSHWQSLCMRMVFVEGTAGCLSSIHSPSHPDQVFYSILLHECACSSTKDAEVESMNVSCTDVNQCSICKYQNHVSLVLYCISTASNMCARFQHLVSSQLCPPAKFVDQPCSQK